MTVNYFAERIVLVLATFIDTYDGVIVTIITVMLSWEVSNNKSLTNYESIKANR